MIRKSCLASGEDSRPQTSNFTTEDDSWGRIPHSPYLAAQVLLDRKIAANSTWSGVNTCYRLLIINCQEFYILWVVVNTKGSTSWAR